MSQNARLALKHTFWEIRRAVLAKFDYIPHIKCEPGHLYGHQLASYGHPRKNTIVYSDMLLAESPATQRAVLWHHMGLALYDHFQAETVEQTAIVVECESCTGDEHRIALFLNLLGIGPDHESPEPEITSPSDAAKCRDKAQRGAGAA